jgi:hypothetical protein
MQAQQLMESVAVSWQSAALARRSHPAGGFQLNVTAIPGALSELTDATYSRNH